jgi:hypothetical protein
MISIKTLSLLVYYIYIFIDIIIYVLGTTSWSSEIFRMVGRVIVDHSFDLLSPCGVVPRVPILISGRQTGLFSTWEAYHAQVNCFKGACYRGYMTKEEAMAALSLDDKKIEIKTGHGHPMPLKDVIILVHTVIILILICIILCKLN